MLCDEARVDTRAKPFRGAEIHALTHVRESCTAEWIIVCSGKEVEA